MEESKKNLVASVFLSFVLTLVVLFRFFFPLNQFPYTHDGQNHLARFANYKIALREGQLPPRFAPNLMNHYGYPVFNYNYPLANILSLPFSLVGLNYELTFKILVLGFLAFGGVGVYIWLSHLLRKSLKFWQATLLLLTYLANPYLLNLLYYRGSIGEVMVYGLLPWLMFILIKGKFKPAKKLKGKLWWLFQILVITGFLLAHNVSVMIGVILVGAWSVFLVFKTKKRGKAKLVKNFILYLAVLSLGLSLWFWLPALAEMKEVVVGSAGLQSQYLLHLTTLSELVYSPLKFGYSYPGHVNSLSFWIGWVNLVVLGLFLSLGLLRLALKLRKTSCPETNQPAWFWFFGLISLLLVFFETWLSKPAWQMLNYLRFIQFPWRLGLWLAIFSLPLVAWFLANFKKWGVVFLTLILTAQLVVIIKARPMEYFHLTKLGYEVFPESTSTQNENRPVSFRYTQIGDWQPTAKVLDGAGEIQVLSWNGTRRSYLVKLETEGVVVEPTMRFLGWQTWVRPAGQKKWRQVKYVDNDQVQGRLAYKLAVGQWEVKSAFGQKTPARVVGNLVFLITLGWVGYKLIKN